MLLPYIRKAQQVTAEQITTPEFRLTSAGREYFHPGDWYVIDAMGCAVRVDRGEFALHYAVADFAADLKFTPPLQQRRQRKTDA